MGIEAYVLRFSCFALLGDEILTVNGESVHGLSHEEAIGMFKRIRSGPVVIRVARRGGGGAGAGGSKLSAPSHPRVSRPVAAADNLSSGGGSANDGSSNGSDSRSG